jgi:hypothetical protein
MSDIKRLNRESTLQHYARLRDLIDSGEIELSIQDLYQALTGELRNYDWSQRYIKFLKDTLELDEMNGRVVEVGSGEDVQIPNKSSVSINKDGTHLSDRIIAMSEEESKDPEFLLSVHGYDKDKWSVVSSKSSVWQTHCKGGDTKTLWASKITVKLKSDGDLTYDDIKDLIAEVVNNNTYEPYECKQFEVGAGCLIPTIFDVHFSKLCHNSETGNNYDYKIARQRMLNSVDEYIKKIQGRKFEKVILPIGNDYFNSEFNGATSLGLTPQDNDSRGHVMFKKGIQCLIEVIEKLKLVAPCDVILVPGNHDLYVSFMAAYAIELKYESDSQVKVDSSPTTRKYKTYGKNLFGFTHGSDEKDRLFTLMQSEVPELWGSSVYRNWFTGHFHKLGVEEKGGVTKWSIPSLCATDAWHFRQGYVESIKRTMCFVYDKEVGLTDVMFVNVQD